MVEEGEYGGVGGCKKERFAMGIQKNQPIFFDFSAAEILNPFLGVNPSHD